MPFLCSSVLDLTEIWNSLVHSIQKERYASCRRNASQSNQYLANVGAQKKLRWNELMNSTLLLLMRCHASFSGFREFRHVKMESPWKKYEKPKMFFNSKNHGRTKANRAIEIWFGETAQLSTHYQSLYTSIWFVLQLLPSSSPPPPPVPSICVYLNFICPSFGCKIPRFSYIPAHFVFILCSKWREISRAPEWMETHTIYCVE